MKKLESSLKNMVLVLVGVAVVTGALLALVNNVTTEPKAQKEQQTLQAGIKSVLGVSEVKILGTDTLQETFDKKDYTFIVYRAADQQGQEIGAAVKSTTLGFGGDLEVLVGFATDGKILGYTLLKHAETPGLGAKADQWFQKGQKGSIIGRTPADGELHVSKDSKEGNAVDAITASTITSRAFLKAINQAYSVYTQKKVDAATAATAVQPKGEEASL